MSKDIHVYHQIVNSFGVNSSGFGANTKNISRIDREFRKMFISDKAYTKFQEVFRKHVSSARLLKIKDSFEMNFFFYKSDYPYNDGSLYFCAGPVLSSKITEKQVFEITAANGLSNLLIPDLLNFYKQLPVKQDFYIFEQTLLTLCSGFFGREIFMSELSGDTLLYTRQKPADSALFSSAIADTIENFYKLENQMMEAIAAGNAEEALTAFSQQDKLTFSARPGNALELLRGRFIVLNVLCRKAIEKGGVHPIYIDSISSGYSIRLSAASSMEDLKDYPEKMIWDYCGFVRKFSFKNYPVLIQNCLLYIERHYAENPSLSDIAGAHYVSRQYLSSLFKKTTGKGFTEHLHECQLRHSADLLKHSGLPISRVAECCGQNDVSYFTKLFHNYYGMTPREFKKTDQ